MSAVVHLPETRRSPETDGEQRRGGQRPLRQIVSSVAMATALVGCSEPSTSSGAPPLTPSARAHLQVHFDAQGAHLGAHDAPALSAIELNSSPLPPASPAVQYCGNTEPCHRRLTWDHGTLESWWVQEGDALHQGFTLHEVTHDTTRVTLAVPEATVWSESSTQAWIQTLTTTYSYSGLQAWDATGRLLDASLVAHDDRIVIEVDTSTAVVPVIIDPILNTPQWTHATASSQSMAGGLDLNNDGYDDLAARVPGNTTGAGADGSIAIFLGSEVGLSSEPDHFIDLTGTYRGNDPVVAVGDVNNDGIDDLGWAETQNGVGAVHVLYGVDGGSLDAAQRWRFDNTDTTDTTFAQSLAGGGDLNADGIDDIVVGSSRHASVGEGYGRVLVFFGSNTGPSAAPDQLLDGHGTKEGYGYSVAIIDHPNPSQRDELMVGCWHDPSKHASGGTVYKHATSSGGVASGVKLTPVGKPSNSWWGFRVASGGDTNGDGYTDGLAGDIRWDLEGAVLLFKGTSTTLETTPSWVAHPSDLPRSARLGYDIAGLGDLDGDGYGEIGASAPDWDQPVNKCGKVYLYRGSASGLQANPAWTQTGDIMFGTLGRGVGPAGDTDGDGAPEVVFGWPGWSSSSSIDAGKIIIHEAENPDVDGDGDPNDTDCAPTDASRYTGADEVCDGVDQDCDGELDEGLETQDWYVDSDGDGEGTGPLIEDCRELDGHSHDATDCDDTDDAVNTRAVEVCNSIDDDCDGKSDDADESLDLSTATDLWRDADGDTFGGNESTQACTAETGWVERSGDCDDTNTDINPDADEVCSGTDNNCNGKIDEDDPSLVTETKVTWHLDSDGDTFGSLDSPTVTACLAPTNYVADSADCDDSDGDINPDATEVCSGLDDDCDGLVDLDDPGLDPNSRLLWWTDADADGAGAGSPTSGCTPPTGVAFTDDDCDDSNPDVHPSAAEVCNQRDDNCDTRVDDDDPALDLSTATTWWVDADGDGAGDRNVDAQQSCNPPPNSALSGNDCDDTNPAVKPIATERCNDVDDNCDGRVDNGVTFDDWYLDNDGDGSGAGEPLNACSAPDGRVLDGTDCDDDAADVFPGADEVCNSIDDDCDGETDEGVLPRWLLDADGDGYGGSEFVDACDGPADHVLNAGDCDDDDPSVLPGSTERCNGRDDDCNGLIDADDPEIPDDCQVLSLSGGCGCASGSSPSALWLAVLPLALRRRRSSQS